MSFFGCIKNVSPLLLLGFISACSNNQTHTSMRKLQSDFDDYKYSSYVSANLKPETVVTVNKDIKNNKQMALAKRKLKLSKKRSSTKIANTVKNNGLYEATKLGNVKELTRYASLDNILALALQNNLDIKSAKEQVIANLAKYDQVGFLDDMLSQYAAFTETKKPIQFPFPGLLGLKSSIIDQSVETSRLRLKQKAQDVITQTRIAYYELQFIRAEVSLIKQDIGLLKSLKKELQNNYSSNTGDLDGVLQVDIDIATSRNNLQVVNDKFKAQQVRLNTLLNISPDLKMGQLDKIKNHKLELSFDTETYLNQAQNHRIEITLLSSELAQIQKVIKLSQKRFYPNLDSGFSRTKKGQFSTKPQIKTNSVFGNNDAYLTEIREKAQALKSKIAALKSKTADEVQQIISNHQIARKTHKLYQNTVIPKSKVSLEIAKNRYETGETNYAKVLKVNNAIIKYRLKSLKMLKQSFIDKALLERLASNEKFI